MSADAEWEALPHRTRAPGKELGLATEADVESLPDEFRREREQSAAR